MTKPGRVKSWLKLRSKALMPPQLRGLAKIIVKGDGKVSLAKIFAVFGRCWSFLSLSVHDRSGRELIFHWRDWYPFKDQAKIRRLLLCSCQAIPLSSRLSPLLAMLPEFALCFEQCFESSYNHPSEQVLVLTWTHMGSYSGFQFLCSYFCLEK